MAYCTNCGTVIHYDDMPSHICDPALVPAKGEEMKPTMTKVTR